MANLKDTDINQNLEVTGNLEIDGRLEIQQGNLIAPQSILNTNNTINCEIFKTQQLIALSGYKVPVILSSGTFYPGGGSTFISTGQDYFPNTNFNVPTNMDVYVNVNISNRPNRSATSYIYYSVRLDGTTLMTGNAGNSSASTHRRSHMINGLAKNVSPGTHTLDGRVFISGGTTGLHMSSGEGPGLQYYILGTPV